MAYLNLDPNYFEHPKTKRLLGLLGKGAESLPIKLWCHCAKFHPEQAMLQAYLPEEIEAIVGWDGEKGKMVNAMVKVGFLIKKDDIYAVKDWLEHEGHIAKFKKRSRLAAKIRWNKIIKTSNATSNAKSEAKHPNLTLPTLPNQALLNKEKEAEPSAVSLALKEVEKAGIQIYALINQLKKQIGQPKDWQFPDDVLLRVCAAYEHDKASIKAPWPWFLEVIKAESALWYANQQIKINDKHSKWIFSLSDILTKEAKAGV